MEGVVEEDLGRLRLSPFEALPVELSTLVLELLFPWDLSRFGCASRRCLALSRSARVWSSLVARATDVRRRKTQNPRAPSMGRTGDVNNRCVWLPADLELSGNFSCCGGQADIAAAGSASVSRGCAPGEDISLYPGNAAANCQCLYQSFRNSEFMRWVTFGRRAELKICGGSSGESTSNTRTAGFNTEAEVVGLPQARLFVMGDRACGKTSFLQRFVTAGCHSRSYTPFSGAIAECCEVRAEYLARRSGDERRIKLQLVEFHPNEHAGTDTAFRPLRAASAVLVIYDVSSRESWRNVRHWLAHAARVAGYGQGAYRDSSTNLFNNVKVLLVGHKIDHRRRAVGSEDIQALRKEFGGVRYAECSSRLGIGVKAALHQLLCALLDDVDSIIGPQPTPIAALKRSTEKARKGRHQKSTEESSCSTM